MNKKNDFEIFFNHHAPEYMENVFTKNTEAEVEFIIKELNLPEGSIILDIGCGTGRHSVALAKKGYRMTGLDISNGMLNQAEKKAETEGVEVEWIHTDATKFTLERKYDAAILLCEGAFSLFTMEDDPLEHDIAILKNINRSLKQKAPFLMTTLNALEKIKKYTKDDIEKGVFDPKTLIETYDMEYKTEEGTKSVTVREKGYTALEIELLFQICGFEVKNIWGGTAGNWGHRQIEMDDIEIMVLGRKSKEI